MSRRRTTGYTWTTGIRVVGWTFLALAAVCLIVAIFSGGPK